VIKTGPFIANSSYKHLYNSWKGDVPAPERMKAPQYPVYSLPFKDRERDYVEHKDAFKHFQKPAKGKTMESSLRANFNASPDVFKTSKQEDFRVASPGAALTARKQILNHTDATMLRSESSIPVGNSLIKAPAMASHFKTSTGEFDLKQGQICKKALNQIALRKQFANHPIMPAEKKLKS
jgi:hypothetical protein